MNYPKNCTECEHYKTCQRYYGAKGCKFEREIVEAILMEYSKLNKQKQSKQKHPMKVFFHWVVVF